MPTDESDNHGDAHLRSLMFFQSAVLAFIVVIMISLLTSSIRPTQIEIVTTPAATRLVTCTVSINNCDGATNLKRGEELRSSMCSRLELAQSSSSLVKLGMGEKILESAVKQSMETEESLAWQTATEIASTADVTVLPNSSASLLIQYMESDYTVLTTYRVLGFPADSVYTYTVVSMGGLELHSQQCPHRAIATQTAPGITEPPNSTALEIPQELVVDVGGVKTVLRRIPAGEAIIGANSQNEIGIDARPVHTVPVGMVWMARYETTVEQFRAFVDDTGYRTTAEDLVPGMVWDGEAWQYEVPGTTWRQPTGYGTDKLDLSAPVTQVSWEDAVAYCDWATSVTGFMVRLPTEVEWEWAARGPQANPWPWGVDFPNKDNCVFGNIEAQPLAVNTPKQGASCFGCEHMIGNVWEWTSSLAMPYEYYYGDGREDRCVNGERIIRGGAYMDQIPYLLVTCRYPYLPTRTTNHLGFRVVVSGIDLTVTDNRAD